MLEELGDGQSLSSLRLGAKEKLLAAGLGQETRDALHARLSAAGRPVPTLLLLPPWLDGSTRLG